MASYLFEMFGISLLLTLLLELPAAWLVGLRGTKSVLLAVLVNVLTNPAAVLACWLGAPQILVEFFVVATEAAVYWQFSKAEQWKIPRPVLLAVLCNGISWVIGSWIGGFI